MKTIPMNNMSEESKKKTYGEVKILQRLNHPNIIKFHEVFIIKNAPEKYTLHIIAEYADGGDLFEKIKEQKKKKNFFYRRSNFRLFNSNNFGIKSHAYKTYFT